MAKKSMPKKIEYEIPETLSSSPFYGLTLDEEQEKFRDAIWDKEKLIVLCNAKAGSGKTTIAIATACLLYHYGLYDGCYYIRNNYSERLGYLPGDLSDKERPYMLPLYQTLVKIGENPYTTINDGGIERQNSGTGFFTAFTDAYLLGADWANKVIILDETQCMTIDALRAILTRAQDNCKVICIGSTLQIQGISEEKSGFQRCIEHFKNQPWAEICNLTKNYRGKLSAWADYL